MPFTKNFLMEFSVPIVTEFDQESKSMAVKGVAINEVITRNNVKYTAEELAIAAHSLQGKPILKDHNNSVDSIIGRVKTSYFDAMAKNVQFTGEVFDESVKSKIQMGLINNVSIGARVKSMEKVKEKDEEYVIVKGLEFLELSLVAVPGDPGASISHAFEEAFKLISAEEQPLTTTRTIFQTTLPENVKPVIIIDTTMEDNKMEDELKTLREKVQAFEAKDKADIYAKYANICKELGTEPDAIETMTTEVLRKAAEGLEKTSSKLKVAETQRAKVVNDAPKPISEGWESYMVATNRGALEMFKMPGQKGLYRQPLF